MITSNEHDNSLAESVRNHARLIVGMGNRIATLERLAKKDRDHIAMLTAKIAELERGEGE